MAAKPGNFTLETRFKRSVEEERAVCKSHLAASFRIFARMGFEHGLSGHISVRDPEDQTHFWINPLGADFSTMTVSDLQRVDTEGNVISGDKAINQAGWLLHSSIYKRRADIRSVAHAHSTYGKAFSTLGTKLDPITQDACAFFEDHALYNAFVGVISQETEAAEIASVLGRRKAVILQNHGLLTVGPSVAAAAWWFIALDNACHVQITARMAGQPVLIPEEIARLASLQTGSHRAGEGNFIPLYAWAKSTSCDLDA